MKRSGIREREQQRERETDHYGYHYPAHHPFACVKQWKYLV